MTRQRKLITEIVQAKPVHLTAEQIYMAAKERMPSIAVGTVYRNLTLMEQAGEIRRISVPGAPDRFDRTTKAHDHLLCSRCYTLRDVQLNDVDALLRQNSTMQIDSYELMLYGICEECLNDNEMKKEK